MIANGKRMHVFNVVERVKKIIHVKMENLTEIKRGLSVSLSRSIIVSSSRLCHTFFIRVGMCFQKKVSRVGVGGGGGQIGQGLQAIEESGAGGQWWRQQHPSYHHHHHQHHHHYHHQGGYYTSQSHTHNNPVTTMKQSYMQVG